MPNKFDADMSNLIEEMIRSLPPSEMEMRGKEERVKAVAYFLCKNGFKHVHIEPNEVLILGKGEEEDSLFAAKIARPLSEDEPFDKELAKELTKTGDKMGIPRENQILVLVEGGARGNKLPLLQNAINPDFTLSFIYSGMFLEDEGVYKAEDLEDKRLSIDWPACVEYKFMEKKVHLSDKTCGLMDAE